MKTCSCMSARVSGGLYRDTAAFFPCALWTRQRELEFEVRQLRADKEQAEVQRAVAPDQGTSSAATSSAEADAATAAGEARMERLQAQLRATEAEAAALRRQLRDQVWI